MSAECYVCGSDLPYEGDCVLCELRAENVRLKGEKGRMIDRAESLERWGNAMRDAAEGMYDAMRDASGEGISTEDTDITRAHARGLAALVAENARLRQDVNELVHEKVLLRDECDAVEVENTRLKHLLVQDTIPPSYLDLGKRVEQLEAENAQLRKALRFLSGQGPQEDTDG